MTEYNSGKTLGSSTKSNQRTYLWAALAAMVVTTVAMGAMAISPFFNVASAKEEAKKIQEWNYAAWDYFPVQHDGRIKPLHTVASETVRKITGRSKFQGHSAMAVLLSWLFGNNSKLENDSIDWQTTPFLLCEDRDLRKVIFGENNTAKLEDKYVSPAELKASPGFKSLMVEVNRQSNVDKEKLAQNLEPLQRKARSLMTQFNEFEAITSTKSRLEPGMEGGLNFLSLDKSEEAPWFSYGDLKLLQAGKTPEENSKIWQSFLKERVKIVPQYYLPEAAKTELERFKTALKEGKTESVLESLLEDVKKAKLVEQNADFARVKDNLLKLSEEEFKAILKQGGREAMSKEEFLKQQPYEAEKRANQLALTAIETFKKQLPLAYKENAPDNRILFSSYLDLKFPNLMEDALKSQAFPDEEAKQGADAYAALQTAYVQGEAAFDSASKAFFETTKTIGSKLNKEGYPGVNTIDLEVKYNRSSPFLYGWIWMLASVILFLLAMGSGNKWLYLAGFVPFAVSLGYQAFAYYCRITISGRPPVSNMYETVIFVGSMGAIFALIFEMIYKSKVIILSGAITGLLCLVLADQLPVSNGFDPSISPLVPVLRSNYWLIIHVMTIVASYASGALAWVIGNIALIMYFFNSKRSDQIKSMATFAYRSMQVTVLLLAVGTFLGGIWAAESWGRFWGWDPKETWALIALIVYLIPLHARYIGWVKDFGLLLSAVLCFAAIVLSWYGVNFIFGSGMHSYGVGDGGPWWAFFLGCLNIVWVLIVCLKRSGETGVAATAV